jgi:hypothetical protein
MLVIASAAFWIKLFVALRMKGWKELVLMILQFYMIGVSC